MTDHAARLAEIEAHLEDGEYPNLMCDFLTPCDAEDAVRDLLGYIRVRDTETARLRDAIREAVGLCEKTSSVEFEETMFELKRQLCAAL